MRIYEALCLEIEKHTLDIGPGIVEAAYGRIIREWTETITEEDRVLLHVSKLLLEYEVSWLSLQAELIRDLIGQRIVDNWGRENFDDWNEMDDKKKSTLIASHLVKQKALAKAREIWEEVPITPGRDPAYRRDVSDIQAFRGRILRSFLENFA